jgi:type I restriction enzyme S subunit
MNTKKLRQKILDLAIHGKLVAQNPNDEPASELLKRIRAEKEQLIKEGKIKKTKTTDSSHYENVPFEIPNSWEWCKLKDCCHIAGRIGFRGYTKEDLVTENNGAITLSPSNIVNGIMNYDKCTFISWNKYEESPEIKVFDGDILLVKTGSSFGKCALVEGLPTDATINPQFVVLKHISISNKFLTLVLQSHYARTNYDNFVLGTAIPTFTQAILGEMQIPLPPLAEQKRIVEAIDKWFALIDSIENNKADLETIIKQTKSKILDLAIHGKLVAQNPNDEPASELLKRINPKAEIISNSEQYENLPFDIPKNWCWCKLSNISNIYTGNSINENEKKSQYTDVLGTEYIATKDVEFDNSINYKNGISIPEKYIKNFRIAPANSVLMCIEGGSAGRKIGILSQSVCFGNKLCCFSPYANDISSMYIFYYLQSPLFFEIFNSNKNGIIGGVSINNLKKLPFPLPPLEEQKRIVEAIDKAFKYLDAIAESL